MAENNKFEYIWYVMEQRQKEIKKKIEYHKRRAMELEAELKKVTDTLNDLAKGKV